MQSDVKEMEFDNYIEKMDYVLAAIGQEVNRAKRIFREDFVNQHEAYAVILEEIDELWAEIKKNQKVYDLDAQRKEAIQAAAMLVRLLVELIPFPNNTQNPCQ